MDVARNYFLRRKPTKIIITPSSWPDATSSHGINAKLYLVLNMYSRKSDPKSRPNPKPVQALPNGNSSPAPIIGAMLNKYSPLRIAGQLIIVSVWNMSAESRPRPMQINVVEYSNAFRLNCGTT
jgi:hypothetical protein